MEDRRFLGITGGFGDRGPRLSGDPQCWFHWVWASQPEDQAETRCRQVSQVSTPFITRAWMPESTR